MVSGVGGAWRSLLRPQRRMILLLLAAAGTCVCARWYKEGSVLRRGHIMQMEELDMRTVSPHVFRKCKQIK